MARGSKRGNPYRDANGRFASASTGRPGLGASRAKSSPAAARKAAKSQSGRASTLATRSSLRRSRAKLAGRDPADQRLSSMLSSRAQKAAVTRGNKALGTAKTLARARLQGTSAAGTISKKRPKPATATATARPITQPAARVPAAQRPGSMTNILGGTLRALAQADAQRIREIESITGQKVRAPKQPTKSVATVRKSGPRSVSGTLGDNLKQLAQSDARFMRGMAEIVKDATPKLPGKIPANQKLSTAPSVRAQKGAVTQGSNSLKTAKAESRTRISGGRKGVVNKPKGLKPGDLAQRRESRTQKPIISTPKKPLRKAKSPTQVVDQANKLLDRLKLQMFNNRGGAREYKLEARIAKVNKSTKQIVPSYRHNPMRKGSLARSAYVERNRKYGKNARARNNMGRDSEFFQYGKYMT